MKAMNGLPWQLFDQTTHRSTGHPALGPPALGTSRLKSLRTRRFERDCLRFFLLEARAQIRFVAPIALLFWRLSHLPHPCGIQPQLRDGFPSAFYFLLEAEPQKNSCLVLRRALACSQIPNVTLHRFSARRFDEGYWVGQSPSASPLIRCWVSHTAAATNPRVVEPTCRRTLSGPRGRRQ